MNAKDFVSYWKAEKDWQMKEYLSGSRNTAVADLIERLELSDGQKEIMKQVMDAALTDTYYTLLLALDGSATVGGLQHTFKIYDEDKNLISDCGDLEAEAYEQFQAEQ